MVHGAVARQALDLLRGKDPEAHLYSIDEVRDILESRLQNVSDNEVRGAATEFQIRRIMFLLRRGI